MARHLRRCWLSLRLYFAERAMQGPYDAEVSRLIDRLNAELERMK